MLRDRSLIPLSHQHQHGLALCVAIEHDAARQASPDAVRALAGRALREYETEIANHFRVEEQLVFPAMPGPLVETLAAEHREIEALLQAVQAAPDDGAALLEFASKLRMHIRKEENELFEEMQRRLSREQLDALGAAIQSLL